MSESAVSCLNVSIPKYNSNSAFAVLRLILYRNETYRVPYVCGRVHVLSGVAWVTVNQEDIILTANEKVSFVGEKNDSCVISALGDTPLILEIWENN